MMTIAHPTSSAGDQAALRNPSPHWWLGAAVLALWVTVLLHEAAHFGLAALLYSPADVAGPTPPPLAQLIVVGAGPVATLLLLLLACWGAARAVRGEPGSPPWLLATAITVGCAAASRIFIMAPALRGRAGNYDEFTVSLRTGIPVQIVLLFEIVVAALVVWWLIRHMPRDGRARSLVWLCAGIVLGWISIVVLGPILRLPI